MPSCFPILLCILLYFIFALLSSLRRLEKLFGHNLFFNLRFSAAYFYSAIFRRAVTRSPLFLLPLRFYCSSLSAFLLRSTKAYRNCGRRVRISRNRAFSEEKRLFSRFLSGFDVFFTLLFAYSAKIPLDKI